MIFYEKLRNENGKDYAYRVIKGNIMYLELKPGEIIKENELSSQLGISRTPLREVLLKLKQEYLIEVKPQAGTYVTKINKILIEEAIFLRQNMEKAALKAACKNFKPETMIELEKNLFAQKLLLDKPNMARDFHNLDNQFHKLIFTGIDKPNIWDLIHSISGHYNRMRLLSEMKDNHYSVTIKQHEMFVNVIKTKNANKIDDIIRRHLEKPLQNWEKHLINNDFEIIK